MAMMDKTEFHKMMDVFLACDNFFNINYDNATCLLYNIDNGFVYEFYLQSLIENGIEDALEIADELDYGNSSVISDFIDRYNAGDSQGIEDVLSDTPLAFSINGITFDI